MNNINKWLEENLPEWVRRIIAMAVVASGFILVIWSIVLLVTIIGWPFMYIIDKIGG